MVTSRATTTWRLGDIFTMAPAPEIAYQKHVQLRTRWFDEVERVMRGNR